MIDLGPLEGTLTPALALAVGAVLLIAGRRLFWLALGVAGFVFALVAALRWLDPQPAWLALALAFLAGVVGAVVAIFLQRLAVSLAGFLVGGWAGFALWLLIGGGGGLGSIVAFVVAGVLAALLAGALFEVALVVLSSLIGALLIAGAAGVEGPLRVAVVLVLAGVGALIQTRVGRRRVE